MFQTGAAVPAYLQSAFAETNIEDRATVPSLGVSGKVWTISYEGQKTKMEKPNADGDIEPVSVMRAVILDYAKRRGRAYFEGAYDPDKEAAPVCWSDDGVTPDPSSPKLQSEKCASCPRAVKGSKVRDDGKQTVECSPHRMLAVMPVIGNKFFPHALRLKIAITSDWDQQSPEQEKSGWRAYQQFLNFLKANGATHTAMFVTKMKFDTAAAFPKIFFATDRWLTPEEIAIVKPFTTAPETTKLLGGTWTPAGVDGVQKDATTSGIEAPATKPQAATAAAAEAPAPAPAPEPEPEPVVEEDEDDGVIDMPGLIGLDAPPAAEVQEAAQATPVEAAPAKPEPKPAAKKAAAVTPEASTAVPDDVKALLDQWGPQAE
jgi:hypothetical protein